jgi:AraC family transcriptional activator of pobA
MSKSLVRTSAFNSELKLRGFKAYETDENTGGHNYSRKDFYKIALTTGSFVFHYADKTFVTKDTILFFGNPNVPYSCEVVSPSNQGFTCVFSEDFLKVGERSASLQHSPLFKIGGTPILHTNKSQTSFIKTIFKKMLTEQDTDYAFKDELIRNYINLIIHEALKMQPADAYSRQPNASERITSVFLELLERQFPIESTERPLTLKTAQDFAAQLAIHVNYLNHSVKEVTGKSTTNHIAERITTEAKALLQQTDWNISEVAYSLGFDYPTYFNNFFKKMTGTNPKTFRLVNL